MKYIGLIVRTLHGCASTTVIGLIIFIVSGALTVSGLLTTVGIPLMAAGVVFSIAGMVFDFLVAEGDCPYCKTKLYVSATKNIHFCRECKRRFYVFGNSFFPGE